MPHNPQGWRDDMMGTIAYAREIIQGQRYSVTLRFEWNICPNWVTVSIGDIRAKSRIAAVAKAVVIAQEDVETGWDRVVIENVSLIYPDAPAEAEQLRIGVSTIDQR
jgi:hypothetical protein